MPELVPTLPSSLDAVTPSALLLLLFFGTFISEDAACLFAGTAVASGRLSFIFATSACLLGIFLGDMLLYAFGRFIGPAIFRYRFIQRFISDESHAKAQRWLNEHGVAAVFTARFISGLRLPTYLLAGILKTNAVKFTFFFALAAAIWTPLLVGAAAFSVRSVFDWWSVLVLVSALIFFRKIVRYSQWNNRRLLVGRIKRILNWEFWPLWAFYIPVVLYVLFLGFRNRNLTLFTATNPAIPAGGFVGESKDSIYRLLISSPIAAQHLLKSVKIEVSQTFLDRLVTAVTFLHRHELEFPLVLKPNVGERGRSVEILRDKRQLGLAIRSTNQDVVLQEFADGVEASIFYYRFPGAERGYIFSITEKVFPFVTGDGRTSIEKLILKDDRAICLAESYFQHLNDRLNEVPREGEKVRLIEIGTHSKGAIFKDGSWMITEELEHAVDALCRDVEGFHFGRFDVRAESFERLKNGQFKIIELNGVTSESTNIYDPRYNLFDAYRILFRQWKLAFLIGKANRNRGAKPITLRQFFRLIWTRDTSHLNSNLSNDKLVRMNSPKACV
jgi:membrane protein DedA with SNARE-associated domain